MERKEIKRGSEKFGLYDSKGRELGARYIVREYPAGYYEDAERAGRAWFYVSVSSTRDGEDFGPAFNGSSNLASLAECDAYIAKYLAGARKTAERRAKIEAQRKAAREAFAARSA